MKNMTEVKEVTRDYGIGRTGGDEWGTKKQRRGY